MNVLQLEFPDFGFFYGLFMAAFFSKTFSNTYALKPEVFLLCYYYNMILRQHFLFSSPQKIYRVIEYFWC